jgi:HD superfamily phosphodiesterase
LTTKGGYVKFNCWGWYKEMVPYILESLHRAGMKKNRSSSSKKSHVKEVAKISSHIGGDKEWNSL